MSDRNSRQRERRMHKLAANRAVLDPDYFAPANILERRGRKATPPVTHHGNLAPPFPQQPNS